MNKRIQVLILTILVIWVLSLFACSQPQQAAQSPAAVTTTSTPTPTGTFATVIPVAPATCPSSFIVEQTEGPYYKAGSPERTDLIEAGVVGEPLLLTGYVFDKDCNPVPGAWIDFWQADGNGVYDNSGYRLRGHQFTDAQSKYSLRTVMPGIYTGRTNHIHVKLSKMPGGAVVTSQLYFPDSPGNVSDSIFNESMVVSLSEDNGQKIAFFNFKLNQ